MDKQPNPARSASLLAAQEQLDSLRRQRRQERLSRGEPVRTDTHGRLLETDKENPASSPTPLAAPHLGWHSEPFAQNLRAAAARREAEAKRTEAMSLTWLPSIPEPAAPEPVSRKGATVPEDAAQTITSPDNVEIKLYPDLALAMLRENQVAAGRIWFLLRHLDEEGKGWVDLGAARRALTDEAAPLRVCGWRQLRNLLSQGEGLFWKRDEQNGDRLWLRSTTKVSARLNLTRLQLPPVSLPLLVLTESIGSVRAHFYASFHSARSGEPIARETLADKSNISRRTQHAYEKRAGVSKRQNWTIGPRATQEAMQEEGWQRGQALFCFTDRKGQVGRPGETYVAWQLPNSYCGPHEQQSRGRQKQINQQLVDLFTKGKTGNGKQKVEGSADASQRVPRFYDDGQAAARGYARRPGKEAYWKSHVRYGNCHIWHYLPAQSKS